MAEVTKAQNLIDNNPVVVFSKSWCPYCAATKKTLQDLQANFALYELDKLPDGAELQAALAKISGQTSVPNIYISQEHIGGNSDLQTLAKADKLTDLLRDAGALKA